MVFCCCVFSVSFVDLIVALFFGSLPYFVTYVFAFVASVGKVCEQLVRSSIKCVVVGADSS